MKRKIAREKGFFAKIRNNLDSRLRRVRENENQYKKELKDKLEKEKEVAVKKLVKQQSAIMQKRLRNEFNEKLKFEIKTKKAEFDKKKADLNLEMQRKAKELFS